MPSPPKHCGSPAICEAGPTLMGLRGRFWWLLGGWGGPWRQSGVGVGRDSDAAS